MYARRYGRFRDSATVRTCYKASLEVVGEVGKIRVGDQSDGEKVICSRYCDGIVQKGTILVSK